jgi:hypothetical protein
VERMTSALPDLQLARVPAYWRVMGYGVLSGYIWTAAASRLGVPRTG